MSLITRNADDDVVRERGVLLDKLSQAKKNIELGINNMDTPRRTEKRGWRRSC